MATGEARSAVKGLVCQCIGRIRAPLSLTLVLLLVIAIILFFPSFAPPPPAPPPASLLTLTDARLVSWGGQPAVWALVSGNATGAPLSIRLDALSSSPPRRVVLLLGPWSGATHLPAFQAALSAALRPAGWELEPKNLSDLHREREGRFIFLPSGAWPADLLQRWNDTLGPDDTLVYFGVRDNLALDSRGAVHSGAVPPELLAPAPPLDERLPDSAQLTGPNGVRIWRVSHSIDEFPDAGPIVAVLSAHFFDPPPALLLGGLDDAYAAPRWSGAVRLPALSNATALRVRLFFANGSLSRLWDASLSPPQGVIDGPAQAPPGQPVSLQIRLHPAYPQSERVDYYLNIYRPDNTLWSSQMLGGALIGPENISPQNQANPPSPPSAASNNPSGLSNASLVAPNPTALNSTNPSAPNATALNFSNLSNASAPASYASAFNSSNISNASISSPPAPAPSPSSAWLGSAILRAWPGSGLVRLEVADQFGRPYAQAIVQVPHYEVLPLDGEGFSRRFMLRRDGEPLNASSVLVSKDNSSAGLSLPLTDGIATVSSSWTPGPHTLHFQTNSARLDYSWTESTGGAWGVFFSLGLPGMALAALLFLFLRPRRRPSYALVVPAWPSFPAQRLERTPRQMMELLAQAQAGAQSTRAGTKKKQTSRAGGKKKLAPAAPPATLSIAITAADIVFVLQHPVDGSKPVFVSPESAEQSLRHLERTGHLARWREYYLPDKSNRASGVPAPFPVASSPLHSPVRLAALSRLLRDKLLEQGIGLSLRPSVSGFWLDSSSRRWMAWGGQRLSEISRANPHFLVFADDGERRAFKQTLASDISPAASRLRLSLALLRLRLALIENPLGE